MEGLILLGGIQRGFRLDNATRASKACAGKTERGVIRQLKKKVSNRVKKSGKGGEKCISVKKRSKQRTQFRAPGTRGKKVRAPGKGNVMRRRKEATKSTLITGEE